MTAAAPTTVPLNPESQQAETTTHTGTNTAESTNAAREVLNLELQQVDHTKRSRRSNHEPIVVETVVEGQSDDEADPLDPEQIEIDAMDQRVAFAVHVALAFFVVLAAVAIALAIIVVNQFGAFVLAIIGFLVLGGTLLAYFVDKTMREDRQWKPVRQKIHRWKALTFAVVKQEIRNFQLDWYEHLLLEDGAAYPDDQPEEQTLPQSSTANGNTVPSVTMHKNESTQQSFPTKKKKKRRTAGKPRSMLFGVVKPFLKLRKLGRRKKGNQHDAGASDYVPPIV